MKTSRLPYHYISIVIVAVISVYVCLKVYPIKNTADLVLFVTTVGSLVVSFSAFIFAMKTYLSIDSVNVITQMEGNVLENENYVTSFTSLLKQYDMEDPDQVGEEIFKNLEKKFTKQSKTAIEFASSLQYFIDIIVFFPYLFNSKDDTYRSKNIIRMGKLVKLIEKRKNALVSISTGNLILIEETVKLIRAIINYQKLVDERDIVDSTLLEVKGTMLKNSVTQTVYYNYLGLYYYRKANHVLRRTISLDSMDVFSIEGLKRIHQHISLFSDDERELIQIYLQEAKTCFHKAMDVSEKDIMWEGFILYNEAKSTYLLQLLQGNHEGQNWEAMMNQALTARKRITIFLHDILERDTPSHLQTAFEFENQLAGLVKMNILIAEKKDITDSFNKEKYVYPLYEGLLQSRLIQRPNPGSFKKIEEFQEDIVKRLENK
ncbi:hypothetical protein N5C46_16240 [Rossellomorea vietnamensis]|uniref:Uncharacterized protein n=1 Tax=Rossellomorea vietnamensis TaxID=218284 RepID=A0ACD4C3K8_9BACI|nr:hypothetical protein [Rossellomorea vietnamensis]UXH43230.1 hypothetical protein N5C46_16240 [Rossellomorea vietnamensis]